MSKSNEIKLWCWVLGDSPNRVFRVSIIRSVTIHDLKRAIHGQKPSFEKIAVDSLELFQVKQSLKSFDEDCAQSFQLGDRQPLKSWEKISFYWKEDPEEDVLSVILPRPVGTTITASSSNESNAKAIHGYSDEHILSSLQKVHTHFWGKYRIEYNDKLACSTLDLALFDAINILCPGNILLIRKEYVSAYNYLVTDTLRKPTRERPRSSTLITGQPGIGKTLFLLYVLACRLHDRSPVAFQINKNKFALFTQDDVSLHLTTEICPLVPQGTWALSDFFASGRLGVCAAFQPPVFHIVHTSSPSSSCWKHWVKEIGANTYIMDVWSPEEFQILLALKELDDSDAGMDFFNKYGPSPRILLYILSGKNNTYEDEVKTAASALATEFSAVLPRLETLDFAGTVSSKIFTVRPKNHVLRGKYILYIPTRFLCCTFGLAMYRQEAAQQHTFFRILSSHPSLCAAGGWLFEYYAHNRLSASDREPLEVHGQDGTVQHIPVPAKMIAGSTALKKIQPPFNFYWQPSNPNFKGIDAIIRSGDDVWALQYTISSKHKDVTDGLIKIRDEMNHKKNVKWHLVMIGSDLDDATKARNGQKLASWQWPIQVYASALPLGQFNEPHAQDLENILNDMSIQPLLECS